MRTNRIGVAIVAAVLGQSPVLAQRPHPMPEGARWLGPYRAAAVDAAEAERWREDLAHLARELPRAHANAWHSITPDSFAGSVAALDSRIPSLARHEIIVEMARLVARIGDGHTSLPVYFSPPVGFRVLPLRLGLYREGLFVEAADRSLAAIVGARVVRIGPATAAAAVERVAPLISRDNAQWIQAVAPHMLVRIEVLHALGLAPDLTAATLEVERAGSRQSVRVPALAERPEPEFGLAFLPRFTGDWLDARDAGPGPEPLYQQRRGTAWFEYLPDMRTEYVQIFAMGQERGEDSIATVVRSALRDAVLRGAARVAIDLRNNTGGEGFLVRDILREVIRVPQYDDPSRLVVIIGRRTFSAGMMMAAFLERFARPTLAGERTGSSPNMYGSHAVVTMPRSGLSAFASPDYIQSGWSFDRRPWITPRIAALPSFEDYRLKRDPVLAALLAFDTLTPLAARIAPALATGDTAAMARVAAAWLAEPVNVYRVLTEDLNAAGFVLLRAGRAPEAVAVFRLNVAMHPPYANGWDSLGEGLLATGDTVAGRAAYGRAAAMDPRNERAARIARGDQPR